MPDTSGHFILDRKADNPEKREKTNLLMPLNVIKETHVSCVKMRTLSSSMMHCVSIFSKYANWPTELF